LQHVAGNRLTTVAAIFLLVHKLCFLFCF
jgi:hypothetical protein